MSFREKFAWLSLIAIAVTFGPYFTVISARILHLELLPNLAQLAIYGATAFADGLILGVGYLVLRFKFPEDAGTPPDERDLAIKQRSVTAAYWVLIAGMIDVGCIMPFTSGGWTIVHAALFVMAVSEVVRLSVIVVSYRRQA